MATRKNRGEANKQAALEYAVMGYSVFPAGGKKPLVPWKEFQSRCATDEEIEVWWGKHSGANIALVTGAVSGIIVLDIDGAEGYAALDARGFEIPETVHARTARGDHYVFEHPGFEVRNFAGGPSGEQLAHVDLRGDGGFVIAPPSRHPSGADYEWVTSPFDRKPASAPEWLLGLARSQTASATAPPSQPRSSIGDARVSEQYLRAALEGETDKVCQAREGKRNEQLNASAFALGQLVSAGMNEALITEELGRAARAAGLDEKEIVSTLRSGIDAGMREPREIPEKGSSVLHFLSRDEEVGGATPLPDYPVDALPEPVRSYVIEASESIDCPPEMVAAPLLTYVGSTIGNTRYLVLKSDYIVYPILWTAIIAPPGSAKTPADKAARYAIDRLQSEAKAIYDEEMEAYRVDCDRWKNRSKKKNKDDVAVPEKEPKEPVLEHFYTTDATIEAIAKIVAGSAGVTFARDELVGWVKAHDAYKANRGAERAQYLSLWSASSLKVDRKGQESLLIEHPVVGVTGGIQPDVLHELTNEVGRKDGFLERFCFSYCNAPSPGWSERVVSDKLRRDLLGIFRGLRHTGYVNQGVGLAPEAKEVWIEFVNRYSETTNSSKGILRGMNAKMPVHLASITLILHSLAGEAGTAGSKVSRETITAAIKIVEYHRTHNAYVLERIEGGDTRTASPDLEERLLGLLSAHGDSASRSELDRMLNGQVSAADRDTALKRLEGKGLIECVHGQSGPKGGAPAIYWRVRHVA